MYGKGLRPLSIATVAALAVSFSLVFFYAPLDADQGFVQKIFYVHVPMAIVALCGFVFGGIYGIKHLRSGDRADDLRSYVAIHISLVLGTRGLGHVVELGGADARLVPDRLPPLLHLHAAALLDRRPRAAGPLCLGLRGGRRRVRAAQLPRGAAG